MYKGSKGHNNFKTSKFQKVPLMVRSFQEHLILIVSILQKKVVLWWSTYIHYYPATKQIHKSYKRFTLEKFPLACTWCTQLTGQEQNNPHTAVCFRGGEGASHNIKEKILLSLWNAIHRTSKKCESFKEIDKTMIMCMPSQYQENLIYNTSGLGEVN